MKTIIYLSRRQGFWFVRVTRTSGVETSTAESLKENVKEALCVASLRSDFELRKKLKGLN